MTRLSPRLLQATPVTVDHAEGCYIHGTDGRRYLDFTAGIGVTSTGHCHPHVVEAARRQIGSLIHGQYTTVMHRPLLELTERLGTVLPEGLDSLFFANSGSEAVEAALRLARQATGRPGIVVFHGGFHGRTVAAATMTTSGTRFSAGFSPLMGGVHVAPFPTAYRYGWSEDEATDFALQELDYLFATLVAPDEIAAFVVEPVLGEGGYVPGNTRFFQGLRQRADEHGILLVFDEIQTGFGRTGKFFGHQHFDVRPDIITIAKGLASGFPLSGIAASEELMERARPGSQGGTYGANAVSCAAAVATLDVIEKEGLVDNAAARGRELLSGARENTIDAIGDVRGLGLMVGLEFTTDGAPDRERATAAQQLAAQKGLLLLTCGAHMNVVRMIPPLIVTTQQIEDALGIWSEVLAEVR
ncbi:4-aminobutyrate aminotransferase [Rhodococcus rhodochrous J3]|jgi:4-aminobutyrate aminotransferase|uniref:(S)-3-amino-2-methylpropionate transaminase n=2 Tax=Rhodococcus rhodochrous TaxID=1829 RepID=A0AA46WWD2_RHORH|nr:MULTISPECIES: aminotransferase class III-fold pyridoxal phosphate-dependent enzyme [Rhodococcus]AYA24969.1 aminotransferase class III-fold pyridoxal phosphate-dependent enzyme [Rhodococcus rhodochrous]MBF4477608.1 aminotransferase class III-fold pyridoxal phosphate-dependent enzyme [Rhodococcus rhodochrous]MCB8910961.1 aminotransferase class III-fold pyridoxal phosphate-dependent enzyme [Rhodococcus rhodochrous]MDJ0400332.1 aminotransferase class III-fold pyridoxal phosphate-dependent enzyme